MERRLGFSLGAGNVGAESDSSVAVRVALVDTIAGSAPRVVVVWDRASLAVVVVTFLRSGWLGEVEVGIRLG